MVEFEVGGGGEDGGKGGLCWMARHKMEEKWHGGEKPSNWASTRSSSSG
jgi:hypothetical protein